MDQIGINDEGQRHDRYIGQPRITVYLVALYSTGQRWHTYVCRTQEAVKSSLKRAYGMEVDPISPHIYRKPGDPSQTAIVNQTQMVC